MFEDNLLAHTTARVWKAIGYCIVCVTEPSIPVVINPHCYNPVAIHSISVPFERAVKPVNVPLYPPVHHDDSLVDELLEFATQCEKVV